MTLLELEPDFGVTLTLVLVPTAAELPLPGAALEVYAAPELSTLIGPGIGVTVLLDADVAGVLSVRP